MPTIEWLPSPNFSTGRNGRTPIAIVDHITSGNFPGCLEWMQNPISKASAHYLVTKTGRIIQMVKEGDRAWHGGIVNHPNWTLYDGYNPNNYTIGIEHEGMPGDGLTEPQYQSSLWLHKFLGEKYGIPIDTDHIIGHYRIDSVDRANCPGSGFPWERLFKDLKGGIDVENAVLCFGEDDYLVPGKKVATKLGNCAIYLRNEDRTFNPDLMKTRHLVVVGGATVGHPNETLLSGDTWADTANAVARYLSV